MAAQPDYLSEWLSSRRVPFSTALDGSDRAADFIPTADGAAGLCPHGRPRRPRPARLWRPGTATRPRCGRNQRQPGPELGQPTDAASRPHSVLLNSAIAIDIIVKPITATMARESPIGTTQLPHVMPGATRWMYSWGMSR